MATIEQIRKELNLSLISVELVGSGRAVGMGLAAPSPYSPRPQATEVIPPHSHWERAKHIFPRDILSLLYISQQ